MWGETGLGGGRSEQSLLGWVCVDSIFLLQQLQLFLLLLGVHLLERLGTTNGTWRQSPLQKTLMESCSVPIGLRFV